jgi:hypothetical protein
MIGLTFLAIGLIWLALSVFLAIKLPKWLGATKPVWRGLLGGIVFVILMVGPFVDHIVGMRQFEKLCKEQTGLHILPGAANAKRSKELSSEKERLAGYAVPIDRYRVQIVDRNTNQEIAWYYRFYASGGKVGGIAMLGSRNTCAIEASRHPNNGEYLKFKEQVNLTYGDK